MVEQEHKQERYPSQSCGRSKLWKNPSFALHVDDLARLDDLAQRQGVSRYALLQRVVKDYINEAERESISA
jgi:predicted DNA-binding protein